MEDTTSPECSSTNPQYLQPGSIVRHFALAEAARDSGLVFAARSYWREVWRGEDMEGDTWARGYLGGLIDPKPGSETIRERRYSWWVYKAYADLTDTLVHVDSTGSVDGLASRNNELHEARVLLGGYRPLSSDTINVKMNGLRSVDSLVVNDVVHVLIQRIPGGPDSFAVAESWVQPIEILDERRLVFGDSLDLEVTGFGEYDALSITLTPIDPEVEAAPGAFQNVQDAVEETAIGNIARVDPPDAPLDAHTIDLRIPNGVRVIADSLITIRGLNSDTCVVFPQNAVPFTAIENLRFVPSNSTDIMIFMRGAGSVRDCVLDSDERDPSYGIQGDRSSGEITNTTINLTNDLARGIQLEDSSTLVRNCWVRARGDLSGGIGVLDATSRAVIESTFVSGSDVCISVDGKTTVRYCTADSTLDSGILGSTGKQNRKLPREQLPGLRVQTMPSMRIPCATAWRDGDIEANVGVGNLEEDPLLCGEGEYTLRVDSYGNPANNASGNQIGAFPVACIGGILARSTTWPGSPLNDNVLTAVDDTVIPSSATLMLESGSVIEFPEEGYSSGGRGHLSCKKSTWLAASWWKDPPGRP